MVGGDADIVDREFIHQVTEQVNSLTFERQDPVDELSNDPIILTLKWREPDDPFGTAYLSITDESGLHITSHGYHYTVVGDQGIDVTSIFEMLDYAYPDRSAHIDSGPNRMFFAPKTLFAGQHGNRLELRPGTYSWYYWETDGDQLFIDADVAHPLENQQELPVLTIRPCQSVDDDQNIGTFDFACGNPDIITVRSWSTADRGNPDAPSQPVEIFQYSAEDWLPTFADPWHTILEPDRVYEVYAEWTRNTACGGSAYYSFYTAAPEATD